MGQIIKFVSIMESKSFLLPLLHGIFLVVDGLNIKSFHNHSHFRKVNLIRFCDVSLSLRIPQNLRINFIIKLFQLSIAINWPDDRTIRLARLPYQNNNLVIVASGPDGLDEGVLVISVYKETKSMELMGVSLGFKVPNVELVPEEGITLVDCHSF